jgi:hypothetical protein
MVPSTVLGGRVVSNRHEFDPAQTDLITERIRHSFDFGADVLRNPQILDDIPNGAELTFRSVEVHQHLYHIIAYLAEQEPDRWTARTTGRTDLSARSDRFYWITVTAQSEISAKAALDIVESALRGAEEGGLASHRIA